MIVRKSYVNTIVKLLSVSLNGKEKVEYDPKFNLIWIEKWPITCICVDNKQ